MKYVVRCYDWEGVLPEWFKEFALLKDALSFIDEAWVYGWATELARKEA